MGHRKARAVGVVVRDNSPSRSGWHEGARTVSGNWIGHRPRWGEDPWEGGVGVRLKGET